MNRGVSRRLAPREKGKLWLSAPLLWDRGLRCRALSFPATQQQWVAAFRGAPGRPVRARARASRRRTSGPLLLVSGFHDASEGSAATARGPTTKPTTFGPSGAAPDRVGGHRSGVVARGQSAIAATEAPGDRRLPWWYRSITTPRAAAGQPVPRSTAEEQLDGVQAGAARGARPGQ